MCKNVDEYLLHEISNLEWVNCVLKWIKKCKCESICVEVLIYIYIYIYIYIKRKECVFKYLGVYYKDV
jgi:hypothetical protein